MPDRILDPCASAVLSGDAAVMPAPAAYAGEVVLYGVNPAYASTVPGTGEKLSTGLMPSPVGPTDFGPRVVEANGEAVAEAAADEVGMRGRLDGDGVVDMAKDQV